MARRTPSKQSLLPDIARPSLPAAERERLQRTMRLWTEPAPGTGPEPRWVREDRTDFTPGAGAVPFCDTHCSWYQPRTVVAAGRVLAGDGLASQASSECRYPGRTQPVTSESRACWPAMALYLTFVGPDVPVAPTGPILVLGMNAEVIRRVRLPDCTCPHNGV